jgi:hypothetical protein
MPRLVVFKQQSPADIVAGTPGAASQQIEQFLEAVAKFVPVEIITIYMIVRGMSPFGQGLPAWVELVLYGALIVLTAVYLNAFGGVVPNKREQVAIGTVSFVIWTYGIGGSFFWDALSHVVGDQRIVYPSLAGILVLFWSLVTGLINPAATRPSTGVDTPVGG